MSTSILATKFHIPPAQPGAVSRDRLTERLNEGLFRKLTLVSAAAGFGKTTTVREWAADCGRPVAWLSLDEGDSDQGRFLSHLIGSLRTLTIGADNGLASKLGTSVLVALQSPQPPATEAVLTALLNEIAAIPEPFVLVLDDYHLIDAKAVDEVLVFILAHLPPQMHIVLSTREDPSLPLARLRAQGHLTELRAADLRFSRNEADAFFNQMMALDLSAEIVAALEARTEGWIAGLHLAAISLRGHDDAATFVRSFTGSHRFVLDYLIEEVLSQQSQSVQNFLLYTSILDRLCGPLCDAVILDSGTAGQETLEALEHANLFIVPLDNERLWYRYHHLFGELLRQRLARHEVEFQVELHIRASQWYEDNGFEFEAFRHAIAAEDIERAERLLEGKGMPLHFRGAVGPVLNWLESLPPTVMDAWPSLWTAYASVLLVTGQGNRVEETLNAAEAALQAVEPNAKHRDLIGRVAAIRATMAASLQQVETIIAESNLALTYLRPDNLSFRTSTAWKLGFAYQLKGDRDAARQAYDEVIVAGEATGNTIFTIMAKIGLGDLQAGDNRLHSADEIFRDVLQLCGDPPLPVASEAHIGLARICYEWNDLDSAYEHVQEALQLIGQIAYSNRQIVCQALLVQIKLAQGDASSAATILAQADRSMPEAPDLAIAEVRFLLSQGDVGAASQVAESHKHPLNLARVYLSEGQPSAALAVLASWRETAEEKGWADERLKALVLQAIAFQTEGDMGLARRLLGQALAMAEPGGYIRLFVDEGESMGQLLTDVATAGGNSAYIGRLAAAFGMEDGQPDGTASTHALHSSPLVEPLSERELEVLQLVAQGLSNRQISERLFLALSTVKGHNRNIFGKLDVKRRTEAVARARELGLV